MRGAFHARKINPMIQRLVDILAASVVLLFLSPVFALVSLIIVCESRGNPFYAGWRIGKHGMRFRMWKFRTMIANADRMGGAIAATGDPRITRVGHFLRATKIDELPQFFNLLLGDLTLVGPRPEDPAIVAHYTPEQRQTLRVKPGLTGPGQIYYTTDQVDSIPQGVSADEYYLEHLLDKKLRRDLDYLELRTPLSDCHVIWQTIVLMARALVSTVR
jgi:lipopolysaccharide/colanic/teichoic acid biosynthesis glycosyltransferase